MLRVGQARRCNPQDGAIAEAVVWEAGPGGRHLIPDALVAYALGRHLPDAAVVGTAGVLDGALAQAGASPDQLASARRCGPSQRVESGGRCLLSQTFLWW